MRILDRLPSLDEHLGPARADEYEEWLRTMAAIEGESNEHEAAAVRMLRTMTIACMETLSREREHGRSDAASIVMWPRVAGIAIAGAHLSVLRDDIAPRRIVPVLIEEFPHGREDDARHSWRRRIMSGTVNKAIVVGHLGREPRIRAGQDGKKVASFSVATGESWRDKNTGERKEVTHWHNVVVFNEALAEVAEKYLRTGSKVYVEGQMQTRKWQDRGGQERYITEIVLKPFRGELGLLDRSDRAPEAAEDAYGGDIPPLDDEIPF